jgi:hypothetical protein
MNANLAKIKDELIYFIFLTLSAIFFVIPVFGLCMFDSEFHSSKRFASVLLILFM